MPRSPLHTTPPADGRPVVFFDGECPLCTRHARRMERRSGGFFSFRSFREAGALAPFRGLTVDACELELKLVDTDGRVFGGAEAVARVLVAGSRGTRWPLQVYRIPGVRWLLDRTYTMVARHRARLSGRHSCRRGVGDH